MLPAIFQKKIEILKCFNRCRIHRNEEEFRKMVLDGYHNPDFLKVQSYGNDYSGQIVYHIGAFGRSVGFFAEFLYALNRLYFASDRGLTPYIYWGDNFLYYEHSGVCQEQNAFLYYFEPVSHIKDIAHASHVITATGDHIRNVQDCLDTRGYEVSDAYMDAMSNMVKKYIRYNAKTAAYLEKGYDELIGNRKALAVHFRGTDYRRQYNNHPVFVTLEQEVAKVHEIVVSQNYEVIFLATDEQEAVDVFRKEFGDIVKVFEDTWRSNGGDESIAFSHAERENHHYLLGLEVIRDQYMLMRCDGLVGGISNLTLAARMMRKAWFDKDYDDLVVIDHDLCRNDRKFSDASHPGGVCL